MSTRIEMWATVIMATVAVAVGVKVLMNPVDRQRTVAVRPLTLSRITDTKDVERFVVPAMAATSARPYGVDLIEFIDVECPFCSRYARTIDSARTILADTLRVHFAHMPLRSHRFAIQGAVAVECAFRAGVGYEFVRRVYQSQDSIGIRSWARMARDAGLQDTVGFELCRASPTIAARIDSATAARTAAEIPGTPTIWLDGSQYSSPPDLATLVRDIRKRVLESEGLR